MSTISCISNTWSRYRADRAIPSVLADMYAAADTACSHERRDSSWTTSMRSRSSASMRREPSCPLLPSLTTLTAEPSLVLGPYGRRRGNFGVVTRYWFVPALPQCRNDFVGDDVSRNRMEHASTNGQAGLAFSSEELSLLQRRVGQRLNGELFDAEVILRLLATIEQNVQNDRAPTIRPKRSNATVRKRDLQRELATKEAEIAHLRSALARITKIAGQAAGEIEDQGSNRAHNNGSLVLPPMQRLVFEEICKGKTTREIAEELHRSKHTISNHIKMIMKTLGVRTRSALIAQALHRRSRT